MDEAQLSLAGLKKVTDEAAALRSRVAELEPLQANTSSPPQRSPQQPSHSKWCTPVSSG